MSIKLRIKFQASVIFKVIQLSPKNMESSQSIIFNFQWLLEILDLSNRFMLLTHPHSYPFSMVQSLLLSKADLLSQQKKYQKISKQLNRLSFFRLFDQNIISTWIIYSIFVAYLRWCLKSAQLVVETRAQNGKIDIQCRLC